MRINKIGDVFQDATLLNNNFLGQREYDMIITTRRRRFVDPFSNDYKIGFILQFKYAIPYATWTTQSFVDIFENENDLSTFMLLTEDGTKGVPIGIRKADANPIITNDSKSFKLNELKNLVDNKQIQTTINLDFGGNGELIDHG